VAPQVFHVEHLETARLHRRNRLRQTGDPPARKNVLADVELGVARADVTDQMQHAEPAGLEKVGVGAHDLAQLVPAGVLQDTNENDFVVLAVHVAEVGLADGDPVREAAALDFAAQPLHLLGRGVERGTAHAEALDRADQESAEAGADVDHVVAGRKARLACHVVDLVRLRLLERPPAFRPIRARVHQVRVVEPRPVELRAMAVVEARVGLRLCAARVRVAAFVARVADADGQGVRLSVKAALDTDAPRRLEVAVDVELAGEVRLEQPAVAIDEYSALGAPRAERERHQRVARPVLIARTVRERDAKGNGCALAENGDQLREHTGGGRASRQLAEW
jgi:hypothetical protein